MVSLKSVGNLMFEKKEGKKEGEGERREENGGGEGEGGGSGCYNS